MKNDITTLRTENERMFHEIMEQLNEINVEIRKINEILSERKKNETELVLFELKTSKPDSNYTKRAIDDAIKLLEK